MKLVRVEGTRETREQGEWRKECARLLRELADDVEAREDFAPESIGVALVGQGSLWTKFYGGAHLELIGGLECLKNRVRAMWTHEEDGDW